MQISEKKTKAMTFNFTNNYQFTTRLSLNKNNIEIVDQMKILGKIINNQLSCNENCNALIRKVNSRMQLIRELHKFGASIEEMVHFWILFCRSILEQSCVVWGPSLTQENIEDLERMQKSFAKLVLKQNYKNYENALIILNLERLEDRRTNRCSKFANNGIMNNTSLNQKKHKMNNRNIAKYEVNFANTKRLKN